MGQLHVGTFYFDYDRDASANSKDSDDEYDSETFEIDTMIRHERFKRKGDDEFRHDFTILKLNGLSSRTPVRINRDSHVPFPGQEVVAMGLGDLYNEWMQDDDVTDPGPVRPEILQQVTSNYLPNEECRLAKDEEESYSDPPNRIGSTHLCTFVSPNNGRDACAYDSGGPVIIPSDENNGDLLVALVSWGIGCADPIFPAVNARVSAVSDWIDEQVCLLSEQPPADFGCYSSPASSTSPSTKKTGRESVLIYTLCGFLVLVFCLAYLAKRRFCARSRSNDFTDPAESSPFSVDYLGVKRRNTDETSSLSSTSGSDEDLMSYDSTSQTFRV